MGLITQTLTQTIQALSLLVQQINSIDFSSNTPQPSNAKKINLNERKEMRLEVPLSHNWIDNDTTERPSIKTDSPLLYEMTSLLGRALHLRCHPIQSSLNHTAKESTAPREPQRGTLKTLYWLLKTAKNSS
ncbi:hypothetical protein TNCV_4446711 [Trichonephila clavipes]|nr:hypothetical protein TNCV_4446711 [Trichonephila clavipes]